MVLLECADRAAAHVGATVGAHIVHEARIDDLEPAAAGIDCAAAVIFGLVLGIAMDEGQVLYCKLRRRLIVAVLSS